MVDPAVVYRGRSYLTPAEVVGITGLSLRTVERRMASGELPTLRITARLQRVEAHVLIETAAEPVPPGPDPAGTEWLARLWQVHPYTLQGLATAGVIPLERGPKRAWLLRRVALRNFVFAHTIEP